MRAGGHKVLDLGRCSSHRERARTDRPAVAEMCGGCGAAPGSKNIKEKERRKMRFTKYNSMNDIMNYPQMREYLKLFYSEYLLEMYPQELWNMPVARIEQVAHTPWGEPFSIVADQLMDAVNLVADLNENHTRRTIPLWGEKDETGSVLRALEGNADRKDKVFLIAPDGENLQVKDTEKRKPAVIICPGGGYEEVCFSGEGTPVMHYMEAKGYCAFILRYRVGADAVYPAPQEDLSLAVRYVREHADQYGLDPENVMIMGFSAGGHLCASQAGLWKEMQELLNKDQEQETGKSTRPDKVCLCYPVISLTKEPHEGSAQALTGGKKELREPLSAENLVTSEYPPVFVWTCADDDCVPPSNAAKMAEALEKAGVRHEYRLYSAGGHGCALAFSKEACEWSREMTEFFEEDRKDRR